MANANKPLIYLVAGEASGDILGAHLMIALKKMIPGIRFAGVGGKAMEMEGLKSLFLMEELSVMGLTEVLPKLLHILRRLHQTAADVQNQKPTALITIDAPDFNFRLAQKLKHTEFPKIHYVAPTVWAWRERRAKKLAKLYDYLMCLLPFEPPYFLQEGLRASFVGHSVLESQIFTASGERFRKLHNISPDETLLCILPGSRKSEIFRLMPVFRQTVDILTRNGQNFKLVIPTHENFIVKIQKQTEKWPKKPIIVQNESEKFDAFRASNIALAASGTVTLELAMAGVPTIITYKVTKITAWFLRRLLKVKYVNLINLILDGDHIPELLQENCEPKILSNEIIKLRDNPVIAKQQTLAFEQAIEILRGDTRKGPPSTQAANVIFNLLPNQKY